MAAAGNDSGASVSGCSYILGATGWPVAPAVTGCTLLASPDLTARTPGSGRHSRRPSCCSNSHLLMESGSGSGAGFSEKL